MNGTVAAELLAIRDVVEKMGMLTVAAVSDAVRAMLQNDLGDAGRARQAEKTVDSLFDEIDDRCCAILSGQNLSPADVRLVVVSLKTAIELERICDYANQIAKLVQKKFSQQDIAFLDSMRTLVEEMGREAVGMLRSAVEAYTRGDAAAASAVHGRDSLVNRKNRDAFRQIVCLLSVNRWVQEAVLDYHVGVRYIERVADRATNIAELAYFLGAGVKFPKKNGTAEPS